MTSFSHPHFLPGLLSPKIQGSLRFRFCRPPITHLYRGWHHAWEGGKNNKWHIILSYSVERMCVCGCECVCCKCTFIIRFHFLSRKTLRKAGRQVSGDGGVCVYVCVFVCECARTRLCVYFGYSRLTLRRFWLSNCFIFILVLLSASCSPREQRGRCFPDLIHPFFKANKTAPKKQWLRPVKAWWKGAQHTCLHLKIQRSITEKGSWIMWHLLPTEMDI